GEGHKQFVEAAVELLEALRGPAHYPHVLAVEDELLLAYLELGRRSDAEGLLGQVRRRYRNDYEGTLCRNGRLSKDRGVEALAGGTGLTAGARQAFRQALACYELAWALRQNYYPGINVAALRFLLQEAGAQEVAARARKGAEEAAPGYDGEAVWLLATRAEA